MKKIKVKKKIKKIITTFLLISIFTVFGYLYYNEYTKVLKPIEIHENSYYSFIDFGYVTKKSETDYNSNNIDDYTDILNGAKKIAEINPAYVNKYYSGGYPPEDEGTCADVVWYSLKEAGYLLKDMISKDIKNTQEENLYQIDIIDDNIDFRRVGNLDIFFTRYAEKLDPDYQNLKEYNPGDLITFNESEHIAIVSDKVNANGVVYIIQNSDEEQTQKEEDVLEETPMQITNHYRFTYNEKIKNLIN